MNLKCEQCEKEKTESEFYSTYKYSEHQICEECESNLENKTGYCSLSCRLCGECDESC